jgi:hypothetical protein
MNWKNITLEAGFIKQEIDLNGVNAVNFIPLEQVDSFGVVSSENKRWLYAGIFFGVCAVMMIIANQLPSTMILGMVCAGLIGVYFMTKQTWLSITSSQTKFIVQVRTTQEELQAVNYFVMRIKQNINSSVLHSDVKAA